MTTGQFHGGNCIIENLLPRFLQLILEVNVTRRNERVNSRTARILQRFGGTLDVQSAGSGERSDLNPGKLTADRIDRLEVTIGSDGEASL